MLGVGPHAHDQARILLSVHGVQRIDEEIDQHLPEQRGLAGHERHVGRVLALERYCRRAHPLGHQRERQVRLVREHHLAPFAAGESRSLPHRDEHLAHPRGARARGEDLLADGGGERIELEALQLHRDPGERRRQLVRQASGERSQVDEPDLPGNLQARPVFPPAKPVLQARSDDRDQRDRQQVRSAGAERKEVAGLQPEEQRHDGNGEADELDDARLDGGERHEDADTPEHRNVGDQVRAARSTAGEHSRLDRSADHGHGEEGLGER
jgi:hypothetical protein